MDIIIGAGVSGISYANFTKSEYIILEKEKEIGGYCRTIKKDGYVWDYSGHFFHFRNSDIKSIVTRNISPEELNMVEKRTQILYKDQYVDFPFQKNIHQLEKKEFIDCLYDLFSVKKLTEDVKSFKDMVYANLGKSIADKFLIPYNQKLYSCDLDLLDSGAMGRFFPKASKEEIILNFKNSCHNNSYNSFFVYPKGGAIEYINSLFKNLNEEKVFLSEEVLSIDVCKKEVKTNRRMLNYDNLISTIPFPDLLQKCNIKYDSNIFTWNKVLVFNLGFDKKGSETKNSWIYIPDSDIIFYRVGFYDNIMGTDKMSLYVEIGFAKDTVNINIEAYLERVLFDLKKKGIVTDQKLVSYNSVLMDPAYVHINRRSIDTVNELKKRLALNNVFSIGRYGSWTYCSIEDNIIEAQELTRYLNGEKC